MLPASIQVCPVEIPGRGRREGEPAPESVASLAMLLAKSLPLNVSPQRRPPCLNFSTHTPLLNPWDSTCFWLPPIVKAMQGVHLRLKAACFKQAVLSDPWNALQCS